MSVDGLRACGLRLLILLGLLVLAQGCGTVGLPMVLPAQDESLFAGPPITDIVTPYDRALSCLRGRINTEVLRFSVGSILDATGKEQIADGGTAKFVTQGAGDIVQSALFQAGVLLVNRRDPRIMEAEAKWGLRDIKSQIASTFFITGSINSLDFLPGSGFETQIAGLGPRYRQHRILIGLDLSLTETRTGRVLANVPLQKQLVATEAGFGIGRFFGNTLVSVDLGNNQREAVHFALRQMLNLATFELLTQMMKPEEYKDCYTLVEAVQGVSANTPSSQRVNAYRAQQARSAAAAPDASAAAPGTAATADERRVPDAAAAPGADPAADPLPSAAATALPAGAVSPAPAPAPPSPPSPPSALAPGAEADSSYFADEQSAPSAATLQALQLRRASTPSGNGQARGDEAPSDVPLTPAAPATHSDPACRAASAGGAPRVTPILARAPGNRLRITSKRDGTLCVSDASGQARALALRAGQAVELEGKAPWNIYFETLDQLNIVYQGIKLPVPSFVRERMELLERK